MLMRRVPFYYLLILLYVLHFAYAADGNLQEIGDSFCSKISIICSHQDFIKWLCDKQICRNEYQHVRGNILFLVYTYLATFMAIMRVNPSSTYSSLQCICRWFDAQSPQFYLSPT